MTLAHLRTAFARLAILAVLVFIGDRALAWGLGRLLLASEARYSVLYRGGPPADVVVVGNSRGVNGFYAPTLEQQLGMKVQNLSYNGLSPVIAEALVRDWIDHHGKPRVLALEISNIGDTPDVIEGLLPYWPQSDRLRAIGAVERPRALAATQLTHLFAYDGELFLRVLYYLRRSDQDWINRYRIAAPLVEETRHMAAFELETREDNLAALKRLVTLCREQDIALRLVVTPYLAEFRDRVSNYDAWIARIEGAAGVRVWDASQADRQVEHFADRLHMNAEGAEPLMARFVREGLFDPTREVPPRNLAATHE